MYTVRAALANDAAKIYALYRKVAALPEGIARNCDEITEEYIQQFMSHAVARGIELVIDHPQNPEEIIAEIHCYRWGIRKFDHLLTELTIAVSPEFHGLGLGKLIFGGLLSIIENEWPEILRVELCAQESNKKAISFYEKLGFVQEGRFEKRVSLGGNSFEADIPMCWFNKNFGKSKSG